MVQPTYTAAAAQSKVQPKRNPSVGPLTSNRHGDATSNKHYENPFDESMQAKKSPLLAQPANYVSQQWIKAKNMLHTNPGLMTRDIFCLALKYQPPLHVVTSMLQLNKNIAAVPKSGPSALQVAVQSKCSAAVLQVIIQANPTALVETNESSRFDPLAYARRFRGSETDVLKVLSTPLSRWYELDHELAKPTTGVPPPPKIYHPPSPALSASAEKDQLQTKKLPPKGSSRGTTAKASVTFDTNSVISVKSAPAGSENTKPIGGGIVSNLRTLLDTKKSLATGCVQPSPDSTLSPPRPYQNTHMLRSLLDSPPLARSMPFFPKVERTPTHQIQRAELDNMKLLCLTVLKAQKRLQQQVEDQAIVPKSMVSTIWETLQEKTAKQFQTQLVAMDMKEKYLKKRLDQAYLKIKKLEETDSAIQLKKMQSGYNILHNRLAALEKRKGDGTRSRRSRAVLAPIVLNNTDPTDANSSLLSAQQETPLYFTKASKRFFDDEEDELRSLLTENSLGDSRRQAILSPRKTKVANVVRSLFCRPQTLTQ